MIKNSRDHPHSDLEMPASILSSSPSNPTSTSSPQLTFEIKQENGVMNSLDLSILFSISLCLSQSCFLSLFLNLLLSLYGLAGATANVHCYDLLTNKWPTFFCKITSFGKPPTSRTAHVATAVGPGPGPRYGHVMALVGQRYLMAIGGNDGKRPLADVWALDTAAKPYEWRKLEPKGEGPPSCIAHSDGLLLLCGGRDANCVPLASAYGLAKHRDSRWEWTIAPGVFVNARLHVSGGALGGGRMVEDSSSVAILDTAAGVWCDTKSIVTFFRLIHLQILLGSGSILRFDNSSII
ncbi:Serine/threonine-protein phosphatase BSL2 [Camellia lanceoleosa]|uniref:Serine/threonine-protein phosphatase BSL2 n=1 Tax=Camellia lanceoleosa TaxID=1840588 RepID=A0ACC0HI99_9ERIC|nr:Serine/threonine-protein phosphatase BSL2 [Camellia lanceoleosa]